MVLSLQGFPAWLVHKQAKQGAKALDEEKEEKHDGSGVAGAGDAECEVQKWGRYRHSLQLEEGKNRKVSCVVVGIMAVVRFHCPFAGLSGCQDGGGNMLTKTSLITHLRDRHCNGDAQAITRQSLSTNLAIFEEAEVTFKRMGIWLCGGCFKTHSLRSKCRHGKGSDFVSPPDCGDGVVRFVLYDLTKPHVPSSSELLDHVDDLVQVPHGGFTLALLDSLFSKGLRTVKSIPPKCRLGFSRVLKEALDKVICTPDDISCWVSLLVLPICLLKTFRPRSNLECKSAIKRQRQKESIVNAIRSWSLPGGSMQIMRDTLAESSPPLSEVDEEDIDLGERNIKQCKRKICDGHYTAAVRVLSSFSWLILTMMIPFRVVVAIFDELVSSIMQVVNLFLDGKCANMLGEYIASASLTPLVKPGGGIRPIVVGGEAILHVVNPLIKGRGDDVSLSMLLLDFKNAFNLVFWPKEDPRSKLAGIFPSNIARPLHGVKLLGGPTSVDFDFSSELVMKRVTKTIVVMDTVTRINDPQCELLLLRACAGDVLNYAFLASRLQSASLQTKLLRYLSLLFPSSSYRCFVQSQMGGSHLLIGLVVVPISGFGTNDENSHRKWVKYEAKCANIGYGFLPFSFSSLGELEKDAVWIRKFSVTQDIGARAAIHIFNRISFSIAKGVGAQLVSRGLDVCVELAGSLPLTQTGLTDFLPGRAVVDAAHRKRVKYEAKCADIGHGFLPFPFSSFGELEKDAVTLLKRLRKFSVAQDIG
ncbi:hypothetical protein Tco_0400692, partial [Tanacetum coccineum]